MTDTYTRFQFGIYRGECLEELYPSIEKVLPDWEQWTGKPENRIYMKRPNRVVGMELPPPFSQADGNLPPSLVSKDFGCRSPLDKVLSPLSESKGLRSFRIGKTLYQNGVSTPRPIAAWEIRRWGFVQASFYLYEEVSEATLVRQLLKDHPKRDKQLSPVLEDLAKLVRGMHDSGIFHRDLTLGNFLATAESRGRGNSRVSIIDLSRALTFSSLPLVLRLIDLARIKLGVHWDFFFDRYCGDKTEWKIRKGWLSLFVQIRRKKMVIWKGLKKIFRGEG